MLFKRILMTVLAMAAATLVVPAARAQSKKPVLVFACDDVSEACKLWRSQWQPIFAGSPAYKMVDFRAVNAPTAQALLKPAAWPADLRWVLDTFLMSQAGQWQEYETPRFFLLQDGAITASTGGNNGWRDFMWPTLLDVTNTKP
ncbi:hypothetical protein BH11PSE3_BH11PSE3_44660 [soil metagenome]